MPVLPDFGRAAALDDEDHLFVKVLVGVQCAGPRHLDDVAAPQAFGAVELDIAAPTAQALPRCERQILHSAGANTAVNRNALRFHEAVIGHLRALEFTQSGVFALFWFVPMGPVGNVVHRPCLEIFTCVARLLGARGRAVNKAGKHRRVSTAAGHFYLSLTGNLELAI